MSIEGGNKKRAKWGVLGLALGGALAMHHVGNQGSESSQGTKEPQKQEKKIPISEEFSLTADASSYELGMRAVSELLKQMHVHELGEVRLDAEDMSGVSDDINFLRNYIRRSVFDPKNGHHFKEFQDKIKQNEPFTPLDLIKIEQRARALNDAKEARQ